MAMKKCPNGMYAEIKYDGERVQVHKQGDKFEYFSRSLKAVQPHKVRPPSLRPPAPLSAHPPLPLLVGQTTPSSPSPLEVPQLPPYIM